MANSALSRTLGTPTNADKWTWSAWIKRSKLSSSGVYMDVFAAYTDGNNYAQLSFHPDNYFFYYDYQGGAIKASLATNRLFRDTSAWYHIVVATDTPQATAANRVKLYINGEQYTWDRTTTYPSQNQDTFINKASTAHYIGQVGIGNFFNGYMSHVAFVDGQQLAPTVFGETDSTSGIWKFKTPSGVTWGTNGAHIKFENSSNLGLDSSTNTNNWTVAGNLKQALDTPSNVSSVINQLTYSASQVNIQNGALSKTNTPTSNAWRSFYGTLGASSGKYYFEMKVDQIENSDPNNFWVGIVDIEQMTNEANNQQFYKQGRGYGYHAQSGNSGNNNQTFSFGNSWTAGDIIGVAMDLDNAKMYFSKNGTYQNSGVPTSGSTGTGAMIIAANTTYVPAFSQYYANEQFSVNFGNGFFGTTAITSAGSNGNGSLFEYDVPSGYYALNTKNINTYG